MNLWNRLRLSLLLFFSSRTRAALVLLAVAITAGAVTLQQAYLCALLEAPRAFLRTLGPSALRECFIYPKPRRRGETPRLFSPQTVTRLKAEIERSADVSGYFGTTQPVSGTVGALGAMAVNGLEPSYLTKEGVSFVSGSDFSEEDNQSLARVCLLNAPAAKLLFGTENAVGEHIRIANVQFEVRGVFTSDTAGPLTPCAFVPLSTMMRRFLNTTLVTGIYLLAHEEGRVEELRTRAVALLRQERGLTSTEEDDFVSTSPGVIIRSFKEEATENGTMELHRVLVAVALFSACGAIGLAELLAASQRRVELALQRALGATRGQVLRHLLGEALVGALLGGSFGVLLAEGVAVAARAIPNQAPYSPYKFITVDFTGAALGVGLASVMAVVGSVLPAVLSARRLPAEALHR